MSFLPVTLLMKELFPTPVMPITAMTTSCDELPMADFATEWIEQKLSREKNMVFTIKRSFPSSYSCCPNRKAALYQGMDQEDCSGH
jgi:hypothetical protein